MVYRNDGPAENDGWLFTEAATEFGMDRIVYGMGIVFSTGIVMGILTTPALEGMFIWRQRVLGV